MQSQLAGRNHSKSRIYCGRYETGSDSIALFVAGHFSGKLLRTEKVGKAQNCLETLFRHVYSSINYKENDSKYAYKTEGGGKIEGEQWLDRHCVAQQGDLSEGAREHLVICI